MKKFLSLALALCLLALPTAACKKDGGLKKIRLNEVTHSVFYAPMYLAMSLGYFEEEGLKIELTNGGGADKSMTAVLSDSADIGLMGPEAAVYVYNEGRANYPIVFGQLTKRDGSFLVGKDPEPDFEWTDLAGKTILAGRKGGVPAMVFEHILNEHGLFDGADVTLNYDVQFNMMAGAFEGGTGDYVTLFEPTASEFEAAGKGHVVASVGAASGEIPYTAFMCTKKYLEKNEATVRAFLRALCRATKFLEENGPEKAAPYLEEHFAGTSVASLRTSLESYLGIDAWTRSPAMKEEAYDRLLDIMENAGELDERAPFDRVVNTAIASEVYEEVLG